MTDDVIISYKGFNLDWTCQGFSYEIGRAYKHAGMVQICASGFHACESPFDVFGYYPPGISRYAVVEQRGALSRKDDGDSKIASAEITIKLELALPEFVKRGVDWILSKADFKDAAATNTGDLSAATNTGDLSAATNTGDRSAATVEGKHSVAIATGFECRAKASAGGAICLVCRNDKGKILAIRATKIGENGTEPDVFYRLNAGGKFVRVEDA